jgi:uncharacterized phiE125 gp8 family phage protein
MSIKCLETTNVDIVPLEDIKAFLRIQSSADDALLKNMLRTAVVWVEEATGKTFLKKKLRYTHTNNVLVLPAPPIIEIVEVRSKRRVLQESEYTITHHGSTQKVSLPFSWKNTAISVTYWAGFGETALEISDSIKNAIMTTVAYMYENHLQPSNNSSPYQAIQPWIQYHRTYQVA